MSRWTVLALGLVLAQTTIAEQPTSIWCIGVNEGDYHDLAMTGLDKSYGERFGDDVVFIIGRNDAAKDFSAVQPGPADGWAGRRSHVFRVEFAMEEPFSGRHEFRIDLVGASEDPPPIIRVTINDKTARTVVRGGRGEIALIRPGRGESISLRFAIPPRTLMKGMNHIQVETIGGSWLLYDAWSLHEVPDDAGGPLMIHVRPTPFFIERDGQVLQEIRIEAQGVMHRTVDVEVSADDKLLTSERLEETALGVLIGEVYVEPTDKPRALTVVVRSLDQQAEATVLQKPQKKWRLYCAPSSHTDIGYTHLQTEVADLHNRNTDYALELIDEFPGYHWNLEASWAVQMWLDGRPRPRHEQLFRAVRSNRIGVEASYLNMLSGLCSTEELIRVLYYSARLNRDHGLPFVSCTITDSPSHVWPLPSILAGAGLRYLSVGVNQSRAPLFKQNIHHKSPFWWEGPDGGRVLTWFAQGYHQGNQLALTTRADTRDITPRAELDNEWVGMEQMRDRIEAALMWWNGREDYPYDAVLFHGTHDDNVYIYKDTAQAAEAFNSRYAFPEIILCSNQAFFEYIEEHFAEHIPTVRGCGGSWWEDGAGSSAHETARNRRAHQDIVAAEAVWAMVIAAGGVTDCPRSGLDRAWENVLLYDEHTWGSQHSMTDPSSDPVQRQWAVKAAYAANAADQAKSLLADGLDRLAASIDAPSGSVVVLNPSGRVRTGVVHVDLAREEMLQVNGTRVPQQVVSHDVLRSHTVAFLAENVPAGGYRTYDVVSGVSPHVGNSSVGATGNQLENEYYRLEFDVETGGIASLVDRKRNRDLVDHESPCTFGQMIYVTGGDAGGRSPDPAAVQRHTLRDVRIERGATGAVFSSMKSCGRMDMFPNVEMEVLLYEGLDRVDFIFRFRKKLTYDKEALYIAFPFAGENPRFRYEVGGGSVRPNEDHFPGACRDWFAVQRWITVNTDEGAAVWTPVDTPLVTLCDMTPGRWLDELTVTNGTVFAYVMNNYWYTNYKAGQDGEFEFRFSVAGGDAISPEDATLFGESCVQALRTVRKPAHDQHASLPGQMSFCRVYPRNVALTTMKLADNGDGVIVRVRETAGKNTEGAIDLNLDSAREVWQCDLVERNWDPLQMQGRTIPFKIRSNAMLTFRIALKDGGPTPAVRH